MWERQIVIQSQLNFKVLDSELIKNLRYEITLKFHPGVRIKIILIQVRMFGILVFIIWLTTPQLLFY